MENRLSTDELAKLRKMDFAKTSGCVGGEKFLAEAVGSKGSAARADFDAKAKAWYYGEVLRERRKEIGLTQKDLAEMVGRDRTYINRIEKGETDLQLSSFIRIASALGVSLRLDMGSL